MKKSLFLVLGIMIISLISAQGGVTVYVKDSAGNPIEGATVVIQYKTEVTDSEGKAVFTNLAPVSSSMGVSKEGYESYSGIIFPTSGMVINVTLYKSTPGYLFGAVYLNSEANPLTQTVLEIYDKRTEKIIGTTITDSYGKFEYVTNIDRDCYIVVRDYPNQKFDVTPFPDTTGEGVKIVVTTGTETPTGTGVLDSNITVSPGFVSVIGKNAAEEDARVAIFVRSSIQSWLNSAPDRISLESPTFAAKYGSVPQVRKDELKVFESEFDDFRNESSTFILFTIGGPQVNKITKNYNGLLTVKFVEEPASPNKWILYDTKSKFRYDDSEYGIITFLPIKPVLNNIVMREVTGGEKLLVVVVIAGNAREGTYAAGLKFLKILKGESQEAPEFLNSFDKILAWLYTGENQYLRKITIVVKYVDSNTALIVDIIVE